MRTASAFPFAFAAIVALAGCGEKKERPAPERASSSRSAAGRTAAGSGSPAVDDVMPRAAIVVDEAAARHLLDTWLAAQNDGEFAAYAQAYADKLEGIKRVGARTWRFDRAGWLADRQRMFKRPMTVAVKDVVIRSSGGAATVELIQTFSQGTFQDEGPKRLVMIRGKDGFRIAREEMLRSAVAGGAAAASEAAFVVMTIGDKPYVVIQRDADPAWGRGAPRGPFDGFHQLATVDASKAPAAAAWTGRALTVYDAQGRGCDATVGALELVAGGTPHFGEVQGWNGDPMSGEAHRVWSPAERARALWGMSSAYLVGALTVTGDCKPVVAVNPTTGTVFAREAPDAALRDAALRAFAALPQHAALTRAFVDDGGRGPWTTKPNVASFAAGGRRFLVVSASEGSGCGDFLGQLAAVFEARAGKLTLRSNPDDGFLRVDLILDSDGDGELELIGAIEDTAMVTAHFVLSADGFRPATIVTFPNNDCGC